MKYHRQIPIVKNIKNLTAVSAVISGLVLGFVCFGVAQTAAGDNQEVTVTVQGRILGCGLKGVCGNRRFEQIRGRKDFRKAGFEDFS